MRPNFWENHALHELTQSEWEALCDGCGLCCLVKLQDDDTGEVFYTSLACRLLDCATGRCGNYAARKRIVHDCVQLTPENLQHIDWLPHSCAYRCAHERRALPAWHPLITGDEASTMRSGVSAAGRCISEVGIAEDLHEDYVVKWVKT